MQHPGSNSSVFYQLFLILNCCAEFEFLNCALSFALYFQVKFFSKPSDFYDQLCLNFNPLSDCLSFATLPHPPHLPASISRRKRCSHATLNITKFSDSISVVIFFCYQARILVPILAAYHCSKRCLNTYYDILQLSSPNKCVNR